MSAPTRPHIGTINNVQALQLGLHPLNDPPDPLTNAGVIYNRHFIDRAGTIERYRGFEIEAVFEGLAVDEEHDVIPATSRINPFTDDPVAEVAADSWRMTGVQHITWSENTIRFAAAGSDLFTVRLLNPLNSGPGRSVSFYIVKYFRDDQ